MVKVIEYLNAWIFKKWLVYKDIKYGAKLSKKKWYSKAFYDSASFKKAQTPIENRHYRLFDALIVSAKIKGKTRLIKTYNDISQFY